MGDQHRSSRQVSALDQQPGAYRAFAAERLLALLKRARRNAAAPKVFTGCVSEISSCEQFDHDYADALKQYGAVYQAAQAYLAPSETAAHDYSACVQGEQDAQGAQVAAQLELLQQGVAPSVSDDEVESCGYLGWLRH